MYIYWTKEGKFETENQNEIPWAEMHSPNEETPALIWPNGTKEWFFEGKRHRLSGPAVIWGEDEWFCLNDELYVFEDWLKLHPNQDISFQTKMKLQYN